MMAGTALLQYFLRMPVGGESRIMRCIGVYGASGFGKEVLPLVRAQYGDDQTNITFIDDGMADGDHIFSFDSFAALPYDEKLVTIAIADSKVREKIALRCADAGFGVADVKAPNFVMLDDVEIGEGSILASFAHLTSKIRIGRYFHANFYSYVAHDCVIGDFVTFAPSVRCNGNVHIEDHAYIGAGAILRQGTPQKPLRIGRGAFIGMGAVVTKDVAAGDTVIGNPARPMVSRR
ncbi:acetyltransferase [Sphingomonas sp. S1-29]|uniref:acetyltransferase n=1 Tax=Sphingomonas sp. S1-29 TaxID=2991074 RepID=UPI002240C012|nr:acetyltransferase [Sphingomonas sp. S1-29]UZK68736.1 acetyltransferase [Sphingomonas sp. S1-29]